MGMVGIRPGLSRLVVWGYGALLVGDGDVGSRVSGGGLWGVRAGFVSLWGGVWRMEDARGCRGAAITKEIPCEAVVGEA